MLRKLILRLFYVSLGGGLYITKAHARELRKLAARADTGKGIDLGAMTHDERRAWLKSRAA